MIQHNFKYHPPVGNAAEIHAAVREKAKALAEFIDQNLPAAAGREKATAITKCEEAMFWACAGIARHSADVIAASAMASRILDRDHLHAVALASIPDLVGDVLPRDIQVFPPGEAIPFTLQDFPGEKFTMKVDASVAARAQADLEKLIAAEAQGAGSRPFGDRNHEDAEATLHPRRFFWGGEDPKTGGVRLEVDWTPFGADLVRAKAFKYFSGNFLYSRAAKKFLGLINENIGGLVNRPGFASQQAFAKADSSTNKQTETMITEEKFKELMSEALKPLGDRISTLEAHAKGGTAATAKDADISKIIGDALKPITDDIKSLKDGSAAQLLASAKATVETIGVKGGRIAAQDKDGIEYWTHAIVANAKAAEQLGKIIPNPAFLQVIAAQAGAGGTTTATGEHEFIVKARAFGDTNKISDALDAQMAFARTAEGSSLYNQYQAAMAPKNRR